MTTKENSRPRIGFIGMGHMGSHMALRLMNAGYHLTVYDRTREKAQAAGQRGALVAQTPKDLAASCEVIISCVTDDRALEDVMFGPNGALAGVHASSIIIDMSTVSPHASRHLFQAAKEKGVQMIDAAVSGSVPQVEQGSLVIFVGGEQETYEQCKPILDVLGKQSFYIGSSGTGTTMKLVVNTLLGLSRQALAEALVLGEKAGLEREQLINIIKQTAVVSPRQKADLENARRREYPADFPLELMHKDFGLILNEALEVSAPMPSTAAAQQMYTAALRKAGEEDASAIIQFMEELAGLSSSS
jgi:3-hydroxyisobutyrate dehydrogenase